MQPMEPPRPETQSFVRSLRSGPEAFVTSPG